MATSNIWELTLNQTMAGQTLVNVFFYRGNAATNPPASDIGEAFIEQILPDIRNITDTDVTFESLDVRDILTGETPVNLDISLAGLAGSGASLPAHDAYSFKLAVGTNVTRPGHKRFAGVAEPFQEDGVVNSAGLITDLNDLALTLALNLFDTTTGLVPWAAAVIVKRILDGDSYRLPTTIGEAVTQVITDVIPSLIISTQNSRKQRAT